MNNVYIPPRGSNGEYRPQLEMMSTASTATIMSGGFIWYTNETTDKTIAESEVLERAPQSNNNMGLKQTRPQGERDYDIWAGDAEFQRPGEHVGEWPPQHASIGFGSPPQRRARATTVQTSATLVNGRGVLRSGASHSEWAVLSATPCRMHRVSFISVRGNSAWAEQRLPDPASSFTRLTLMIRQLKTELEDVVQRGGHAERRLDARCVPIGRAHPLQDSAAEPTMGVATQTMLLQKADRVRHK